MFRIRDLHPPLSPPPPQENVKWLEEMNDDDDNQGVKLIMNGWESEWICKLGCYHLSI
jgi:hypothetical protein